MRILLVFLIGGSSILISKRLFHKWFNHLFLYSVIWMIMIVLYEMKLIFFYNLSSTTWTVIIVSFISFFLGIIILFAGRSVFLKERNVFKTSNELPILFLDNGKLLKYLIILFSLVGLYGSLQHWNVLLNKYGSIPNVLLHSYAIYRSRFEGEIEGVLPYFWLCSYFAVFLAGIYSAYKRRIVLISIIPLIAIVLKELARLTRAGILFGLLEFIISFLLFRHLLSNGTQRKTNQKFKIAFSIFIALLIMISGASAVKLIRNPTEEFKGTKGNIEQFKGGAILSPSIYFYATSQIVALNQYLEKDKENLPFGNSTFFPIYTLLSKFDFIRKPSIQHEGYYTPVWSNTATYLRDIHSDFGYSGIIIFPFLLGLFTTFYWFKFYETHSLIYHVILTHFYLLIAMSFFVLATRFPAWNYGLILFLFLIPLSEKFLKRNQN